METNDETRRQHPLQSRTGAYGYPIYLGVSDCIYTTARLWAGVGFFCEAPARGDFSLELFSRVVERGSKRRGLLFGWL